MDQGGRVLGAWRENISLLLIFFVDVCFGHTINRIMAPWCEKTRKKQCRERERERKGARKKNKTEHEHEVIL